MLIGVTLVSYEAVCPIGRLGAAPLQLLRVARAGG